MFQPHYSMCACSVTQWCPTLCDPMNCSPPGSFVHRILQTRILEWVAISSSRGSSQPRDQTCVSCIGRQILYHCATWEALSGSYVDTVLFNKGGYRMPYNCISDHILWPYNVFLSPLGFCFAIARHRNGTQLPFRNAPLPTSQNSENVALSSGLTF